ncbi:MAG: 9-O-acetylesterase [Armatimonadetes bacterium]|nr:9-O-acetylesterase [Armatimonadota bacterium]NOG93428.1 9-O-acetylesterase [Armatimonadota bacterium]
MRREKFGLRVSARMFAPALFAIAPSFVVAVSMPPVFSDHMVVQRQSNLKVWGWGDPGESVSVSASWTPKPASTVVRSDGSWEVALRTPNAGGPYSLRVRGNNVIEIQDVLVGEVWFCSGQSNMEWPLGRVPGLTPVDNCDEEVANAKFPQIRQFLVQKARSRAPQESCVGRWSVCSPATAGSFSATAYFFGRELHKALRVPIGLINSTWGGTEVERWTPTQDLKRIPGIDKRIEEQEANLRSLPERIREWEAKVRSLEPGLNSWMNATIDDSAWNRLSVLGKWAGTSLAGWDGSVWYRGTFTLSEGASLGPATLELGTIDDDEITWVNGREVGRTAGWDRPRTYALRRTDLKPGTNVVTVRVWDSGGEGGFSMSVPRVVLADGKRLEIGNWKWKEGVEIRQLPPHPSSNLRAYSDLYNAMVHPLRRFAIRGAIWYQGESNVSRAEQYAVTFPAMIHAWRREWDQPNFPFYFVQIAPFAGYGGVTSAAELREAQLLTLSTSNTGMIVTTDITPNVNDIHPSNKQDVGKRLALWALAKSYGMKHVVPSGPLYRSAKVVGREIMISFDFSEGLVLKSALPTGFQIAGRDGKFVPAEARVEGKGVVVWSKSVPTPMYVRYGWEKAPIATLFNSSGLPVSPFRTDSFPRETAGVSW